MNLFHYIIVEVLWHEDVVQKKILEHVNKLIYQKYSENGSNYYLTIITMNNSCVKVIKENIQVTQNMRLTSLPFDEKRGEYYGEYARIGKAISLGLDMADNQVYKQGGTAYFDFIATGYDNSSDISRKELCQKMASYKNDFGWHFSTTLINGSELRPNKHFTDVFIHDFYFMFTLLKFRSM